MEKCWLEAQGFWAWGDMMTARGRWPTPENLTPRSYWGRTLHFSQRLQWTILKEVGEFGQDKISPTSIHPGNSVCTLRIPGALFFFRIFAEYVELWILGNDAFLGVLSKRVVAFGKLAQEAPVSKATSWWPPGNSRFPPGNYPAELILSPTYHQW